MGWTLKGAIKYFFRVGLQTGPMSINLNKSEIIVLGIKY